jgi:hypothetical protein
VAVEIAGDRRGCWYDHENGCGGGLWQLITVKGGMSSGAAVTWLRRELGVAFDEGGAL